MITIKKKCCVGRGTIYLTLFCYLLSSQLRNKAEQRFSTSSLAWYQRLLRTSFFFSCKCCLYCLMFYKHIHKCYQSGTALFTQYPYSAHYYVEISLVLCCQRFILQIFWKPRPASLQSCRDMWSSNVSVIKITNVSN